MIWGQSLTLSQYTTHTHRSDGMYGHQTKESFHYKSVTIFGLGREGGRVGGWSLITQRLKMRQLPNKQNEELFYPALISNFSAKQQMTMTIAVGTSHLAMNAATTVSSRVGSYSSSKLGQTSELYRRHREWWLQWQGTMACSSISSWSLDTATCRSCRWIAEYPEVLKYVRSFQGAWGCDPGSVTLAQQNEVGRCQLMVGNHYQFTTDINVWHQHAPACFMWMCSVQILPHHLEMTT